MVLRPLYDAFSLHHFKHVKYDSESKGFNLKRQVAERVEVD
jgi:hypothetical protein